MRARRRGRDPRALTVASFVSYLRLVQRDPVQPRQRFYALSWQPGLFAESALLRSYGQVGTRGGTVLIRFPDRRAAQPTIERLVQRLLRQHYQVVEWI